jgi:hypothetical protein
MSLYKKEAPRIKNDFQHMMTKFKEIFYYGSEVDTWLPEIMLLPFVTLHWKLAPVWIRVISPPGSGKSAHISMLEDYEVSYFIDELTPKSFISGFRDEKGRDPSKLAQMDNKVIVVSDESTFMEQRQEDRNQVQSILRRAYDGRVSKGFGNIEAVQVYKSTFNMLVSSTPSIDRYFLYNQALGERYINYRMQIRQREALAKRAYENQFTNTSSKLALLRKRVHKFLHSIPETEITEIKIPEFVYRTIIDCANFVALVRTHIARDATGRQVTTLPQPESAGRLVQQLTQTVISLAIVEGCTAVDKLQLRKAVYLGAGSIVSVVAFILYTVWKEFTIKIKEVEGPSQRWFSAQDMVMQTALSRGSVARILEDLAIHRVLDIRRGKKQGGRLIEYALGETAETLIDSTGFFADYIPPMKEVISMKKADRIRPIGNKSKRKKASADSNSLYPEKA